MPGQIINVFVSYSHADASLVGPVVSLLRVNRSLVFQDTDRIPPGKRWRDEIAKALAESNLVVVFWCHHAFRSNEVSTEWRTAIEQNKDVLPLLLDATPLPAELGNFQWIDFRGTVGANHSAIESRADDVRPRAVPRPMAASPRRAVWYALTGVAAAAVVVLSTLRPLSDGTSFESGPPSGGTFIEEADGGTQTLAPPEPIRSLPPPEASNVALIGWILLSLGAVGALGAYLSWFHHRRAKREKSSETGRPHHGKIERQIAVELEAEILRRSASVQDGGA